MDAPRRVADQLQRVVQRRRPVLRQPGARQRAPREVGGGEDRAQRRADLVREAAGELTERADPVAVEVLGLLPLEVAEPAGEVRLALLQARGLLRAAGDLGLLPLGAADQVVLQPEVRRLVAQDLERPRDATVRVAQRAERDLEVVGDLAAAGRPVHQVLPLEDALLDRLAAQLLRGRPDDLRPALGAAPGEVLVRHQQRGLVAVNHASVAVEHADRVRQVGEHRVEGLAVHRIAFSRRWRSASRSRSRAASRASASSARCRSCARSSAFRSTSSSSSLSHGFST